MICALDLYVNKWKTEITGMLNVTAIPTYLSKGNISSPHKGPLFLKKLEVWKGILTTTGHNYLLKHKGEILTSRCEVRGGVLLLEVHCLWAANDYPLMLQDVAQLFNFDLGPLQVFRGKGAAARLLEKLPVPMVGVGLWGLRDTH